MNTCKYTLPFFTLCAVAMLFLSGCATAPTTPPYTGVGVDAALKDLDLSHRQGTLVLHAAPGTVVKVRQTRHEFWFGAAIANGVFDGSVSPSDTARYKKAFLENFNAAVTENALKWLAMQPEKGPVNYDTVDAMLTWTEANDLPLRGHNIYWGVSWWVQPWVKALSKNELHRELEARGKDIATRYKGRFVHYDLNNEMIHDNYYADKLGNGITAEMARWVKEIDPSAQLYLNDYDILTGRMLDAYVAHIRTLLDQGVPIAGIGVQGHLHGETFDPLVLRQALDTLAQFDLPIVITEFNFPGQRSRFQGEGADRQLMTPAEEAAKAQAIVDYYRICFSHPAVEGILMWGFWARENWIPASSLYRADWSPTPALEAYRQLVYDEWWTETEIRIGAGGEASVPAFYGSYELEANNELRKVELKRANKTMTVSM